LFVVPLFAGLCDSGSCGDIASVEEPARLFILVIPFALAWAGIVAGRALGSLRWHGAGGVASVVAIVVTWDAVFAVFSDRWAALPPMLL
jgi:hypothetical protein